jgi:SAM-dependent methyltransferase
MLGDIFRRAVDLKALLAARREARAARHDGRGDLELEFYQACFGNDYLHAGYFDPIPADPESISFADLKRAMQAYTDLVAARVPDDARVLDVGCGTGGLIGQLRARGVDATGLTPSAAHARYVRERHGCEVVESKLEAIDIERWRGRFDVLTSMESFHNVPPERGVPIMRALLAPGGRWINIDYYRLRADTRNRSGRLLDDYRRALDAAGFEVVEEIDVSANTAPSMAFAHLVASRIVVPMIDFGVGRFFFKRPVLRYLTQDIVARQRARIRIDGIDPATLARDKRYLLQVLVPRQA